MRDSIRADDCEKEAQGGGRHNVITLQRVARPPVQGGDGAVPTLRWPLLSCQGARHRFDDAFGCHDPREVPRRVDHKPTERRAELGSCEEQLRANAAPAGFKPFGG